MRRHINTIRQSGPYSHYIDAMYVIMQFKQSLALLYDRRRAVKAPGGMLIIVKNQEWYTIAQIARQ
jgi:hypothetical protein